MPILCNVRNGAIATVCPMPLGPIYPSEPTCRHKKGLVAKGQ